MIPNRLGGFGIPEFPTLVVANLCWDTSTSSQVSNCDGVLLETWNLAQSWRNKGNFNLVEIMQF